MFISESWQLKLWDESVFPVHIGSQFKQHPYGAGHIRRSPRVAHIPMMWKTTLSEGKEKESEHRAVDFYVTYSLQRGWSKSNVKPPLTPGYNPHFPFSPRSLPAPSKAASSRTHVLWDFHQSQLLMTTAGSPKVSATEPS